jgi:hypothetical protein
MTTIQQIRDEISRLDLDYNSAGPCSSLDVVVASEYDPSEGFSDDVVRIYDDGGEAFLPAAVALAVLRSCVDGTSWDDVWAELAAAEEKHENEVRR